VHTLCPFCAAAAAAASTIFFRSTRLAQGMLPEAVMITRDLRPCADSRPLVPSRSGRLLLDGTLAADAGQALAACAGKPVGGQAGSRRGAHRQSMQRCARLSAEKPPKTTECTAPSRAHASIATAARHGVRDGGGPACSGWLPHRHFGLLRLE